MKSGDLVPDGSVPAGVDALGGRGVVEVDDHEDDDGVGEFEVEDGVEEVVFLDLEPQRKGKRHGGYLCDGFLYKLRDLLEIKFKLGKLQF